MFIDFLIMIRQSLKSVRLSSSLLSNKVIPLFAKFFPLKIFFRHASLNSPALYAKLVSDLNNYPLLVKFISVNCLRSTGGNFT